MFPTVIFVWVIGVPSAVMSVAWFPPYDARKRVRVDASRPWPPCRSLHTPLTGPQPPLRMLRRPVANRTVATLSATTPTEHVRHRPEQDFQVEPEGPVRAV